VQRKSDFQKVTVSLSSQTSKRKMKIRSNQIMSQPKFSIRKIQKLLQQTLRRKKKRSNDTLNNHFSMNKEKESSRSESN